MLLEGRKKYVHFFWGGQDEFQHKANKHSLCVAGIKAIE